MPTKKQPKDPKPNIGDDIYVRTAGYISRGSDDVVGGLAKIIGVSNNISGGDPTWFVEVEEHPGRGYNYSMLLKDQEKLKERFGDKRAYPDPDIDTPWIEEGDWVSGTINGQDYNGEKYSGPNIW